MRRLGQALRQVVGTPAPQEGGEQHSYSALMNPRRRKVFEELCLRPCLTASQVAFGQKTSLQTARWHLEKLVQSGYLRVLPVRNKLVYSPAELVREELVPLFVLLNEEKTYLSLRLVWRNPGLTLRELAQRAKMEAGVLRMRLRNLDRRRLVSIVVDGKFRRYFPQDAILTLNGSTRKEVRRFRRLLLMRLKADRLQPRIHLTRTRESQVEIQIGSLREVLRLPSEGALDFYLPPLAG